LFNCLGNVEKKSEINDNSGCCKRDYKKTMKRKKRRSGNGSERKRAE
jgi:hypothetical protein